MFNLKSPFKPIDVQIKARDQLIAGLSRRQKNQVLLGVTGSGKTFTIAQVIARTNLPTLVISHNKTLAGQLYQEMRDFFPDNAVSYFVSYYDFYQPEAYMPATDTYIEKEAQINEVIDKLRLQTTSNILTRDDIIVVASVSCIYNLGSPVEYSRFILELGEGDGKTVSQIQKRLIELQYERSEFDFKRGSFRVRGQQIDIYPAYEDIGVRVLLEHDKVLQISQFDPLTGKKLTEMITGIVIYPAKHYLTDPKIVLNTEKQIRHDLEIESKQLVGLDKSLEAHRLVKRVNYDLEMLKEVGYVNGIENYSRYFDGRKRGDPPHSLLGYFKHRFGDQWLTVIDESHMTVPQIRGMYNGDRSRKQTLINYGFRLQAALDNRPLRFEEFYSMAPCLIYVSATPSEWEVGKAGGKVVEQLVRPTGIIDPKIIIRSADGEIPDLITEIKKRVLNKERVIVTTLTKRIAEDLSTYLKEQNIKAEYLHSDIKTLERSQVLNRLRSGDFDVIIGINLLREGLDLPEVALVAILDADNEGFLRSRTALIQTMGRAARNVNGEIIIYADKITESIRQAVEEVERRRRYQNKYNQQHKISPTTISKVIREQIVTERGETELSLNKDIDDYLGSMDIERLTPYDRKKTLNNLRRRMREAAADLHFEAAIAIREKIAELNRSN